jgi:hypothetical protein
VHITHGVGTWNLRTCNVQSILCRRSCNGIAVTTKTSVRLEDLGVKGTGRAFVVGFSIQRPVPVSVYMLKTKVQARIANALKLCK